MTATQEFITIHKSGMRYPLETEEQAWTRALIFEPTGDQVQQIIYKVDNGNTKVMVTIYTRAQDGELMDYYKKYLVCDLVYKIKDATTDGIIWHYADEILKAVNM